MDCPRCIEPLSPSRVEAANAVVDALECKKCTGHWLEGGDLPRVEQVVDVELIEWRKLPGIETQGRILFCPRCGQGAAMDKVVSHRDQRVVMDVCHKCHGVWLDYGELEAIQHKGLFSALADIVGFLIKS